MTQRIRPIAKIVYFSEEEWHFIAGKMSEAKISSFSAFANRMLLDGEIKCYDFSVLRETNGYIGRIAGSINQIAKRCNENHSVHENDVQQLRREFMALKANYQERMVKAIRHLC
mgnify:CR=1 FL=1